MNNIKRIIAGIGVLSLLMTSTTSCNNKENHQPVEEPTVAPTEPPTESPEDKMYGKTLTWFADFSLESENGGADSTALQLYRDFYGGDINYVHVNSEEKYETLEYFLLCGDVIDMFPYDETTQPQYMKKDLFSPLDPYFDIMGVNEGLWDDMEASVDMFEYNGSHYVVPYSVSDPEIIMYSRKLFKELGYDDPYELYLEGKWDWDTMTKMMSDFVSTAEAGKKRYGICGEFGKSLLHSSGSTVVKYEDGKYKNNINDKNIAEAEKLMKKISDENLWLSNWYEFYPNDFLALFYAMGDWALGNTNANNPQNDIMVVPFPKAPESKEYYIDCDYNAKMLVRSSQNPEAVAAYLKCERMVAQEQAYKDIEKETLAKKTKNAYDNWNPYVTKEQYDAIQDFLDVAKKNPMFDFGYGMGDVMYGGGDFTYDSRGVMNNLTESFIRGEGAVGEWDKMRDDMTKKVDDEIKKFNG